MASQHPDHAATPYWLKKPFIQTHHETMECFLTFSDLGIAEYKWDWEGKLVDESVIERLLSQFFDYFQKNPLGETKFLTFRLPNPKVETEFRIGRTLMGILTAASLAKHIGYLRPPIFEVILPMTETAEEMIDIQEAFREIATLKHRLYRLESGAIKHIKIIPLFEEVSIIVNSDKTLEKYVNYHKAKFGYPPPYLRPYLARSDPALNAGQVATVLAIKIALSRYRKFEAKMKIPLYPIIGSASLPFRGGLTPNTVDEFAREYKGIRTALIQSAFRYDFPKRKVIAAIKKLNELLPKGRATKIPSEDEVKLIKAIDIFEGYYKEAVEGIAPWINRVARHLPKRRERVQHTGLFGYSRGVGKVKLPRAIGFTAALYCLGIPPELIGTGRGLREARILKLDRVVEKYYLNLALDLKKAGRFLNREVLDDLASKNRRWMDIKQDVQEAEAYLKTSFTPLTREEKEHHELAKKLYDKLKKGRSLQSIIHRMAQLRRSLG